MSQQALGSAVLRPTAWESRAPLATTPRPRPGSEGAAARAAEGAVSSAEMGAGSTCDALPTAIQAVGVGAALCRALPTAIQAVGVGAAEVVAAAAAAVAPWPLQLLVGQLTAEARVAAAAAPAAAAAARAAAARAAAVRQARAAQAARAAGRCGVRAPLPPKSALRHHRPHSPGSVRRESAGSVAQAAEPTPEPRCVNANMNVNAEPTPEPPPPS